MKEMNNLDKDLWLTLWGVGLALAIQIAYNGINNFPNLGRGFWFGLVMAGFVLAILMVAKAKEHTTEREELKESKEEENEKPDVKSLVAEYQVLNRAVQKRGSDTLLLDSIMIPSSLVIVTFAIKYRSELGRNILFNVPNAGFVPLLSLILILVPYFLWFSTTRLDKIYFDRIHKIEGILHIEGHHSILEQIKCNIWHKIRCHMWHVVFLLFIGAYLFTAYWLFRETIIAEPLF